MMKLFKFCCLSMLFFSLSGCELDITALKVDSCVPGNQTYGVANDQPVIIKFNDNVNKSDFEQLFSLEGESGTVEGQFNWISQNQVEFIPRYDYETTSRYVIEIPRSVRDKSGNTMGQDYISEFYVGTDFEKPQVLSSVPQYTEGGTMNVSVEQDITITFSKSMNRTKTEEAFSITPAVSGYFQWEEATAGLTDSLLTFVLTEDMEYGKQYNFSISSNAEDISGNTLPDDYTIIFVTGDDFEPPQLSGIYDASDTVPEFWDTGLINDAIDKNINIAIEFSEAMDRSTVENAFSIIPAASGHFGWESDTKVIYYPDDSLKSEQLYQIKIDTGAKDINGLKLLDDYQVEILTDNDNSLYARVGNIWGSNNGSDYTSLSTGEYDPTVWPLTIEMGDDPNQDYYLKFQFVNKYDPYTPVDMNVTSILDNYYIETFGDSNNAIVSDIYWEDLSTVVFKISGLSNVDISGHEATLYRLTVAGDSNGVMDANENIMLDDFVVEIKEEG